MSTILTREEVYFPAPNKILFMYFIRCTSWEAWRFTLLHVLLFSIAELCCFWGRWETSLPWYQIICGGKTVIFQFFTVILTNPKAEICNPYLNTELQSMWGMCMQVLVSLGLRNKSSNPEKFSSLTFPFIPWSQAKKSLPNEKLILFWRNIISLYRLEVLVKLSCWSI